MRVALLATLAVLAISCAQPTHEADPVSTPAAAPKPATPAERPVAPPELPEPALQVSDTGVNFRWNGIEYSLPVTSLVRPGLYSQGRVAIDIGNNVIVINNVTYRY